MKNYPPTNLRFLWAVLFNNVTLFSPHFMTPNMEPPTLRQMLGHLLLRMTGLLTIHPKAFILGLTLT